jgi:glycosyltransferase involved in cell wall biosynthesis
LFAVVIASVCDDARSELLKRACASVRAMAADHDYAIVVVANGPRVSASVLAWLATQPDIRVIRLRSGSHPLARRVGAEMANSEFLAFLDDDDELTANTLGAKLAYFREHPEIDVLVTDGLRVDAAKSTRIFPPPEARSADFVETMMRVQWGACALTLRAQKIELTAFDAEVPHMEWTLTAFELARHHQFAYLDQPTYLHYETTPDSLSKLHVHDLFGPPVWRRLAAGYVDTRYEAMMRDRYLQECHEVAWQFVRQRRYREAWRLQVESLLFPGGLASLPFTFRLLTASLRRLISRRESSK